MKMLAGTGEVVSMKVTITHYSTHKAARCDCKWVTVDQRRFDAKVVNHVRLHRNRVGIQVTYRYRDFRKIRIECGRKNTKRKPKI